MSDVFVTPLGTVSPYPKGDKNCPGFFIEYGDNKILLDCGNGCTRLLNLPEDLKKLRIFISHLHPDHYGDLLSLIQAIKVYDRFGFVENDINIYIPDDDRVTERICLDGDDWDTPHSVNTNILDFRLIRDLTEKGPFRFNEFIPSSLEFDDITLTSITVPHQISSYAIKVATPDGVIVYSSDTGTRNNLAYFAKDCDLFICEATFLKGQYRAEDAHLYAWEAATIAKNAGVKKLLLTHFWPEIDKEKYLDEAKSIFENVEVAEEGKKLVLRR